MVEKAKPVWCHLHVGSLKEMIPIDTENKMVVAVGWGCGELGDVGQGIRNFTCKEEQV